MGFIALMVGALFYAARLPVQQSATTPSSETSVETPQAQSGAAAPAPVYPAFSLPDLAGADRNFEEWRGSHTLLNFWATWCAPCRREIPLLKEFQDAYGDQGIQVIGIAVDFPDQVAAYAEQAEFNYPVLIGQEDAMAVAETSGIEFIGMPFTMIVAADGELLSSHMGEIFESDLQHIVSVLEQFDNGDIGSEGAREALNSL
jgi:thiol-disulfide isomerase/thioredoxin